MKVVCFGDSNTYGYDPRSWLGGRYPADSRWVDLLAQKTGWEVVNLGENGQCIPLRPITLPADADLVIVMLGTNDLLQGCTPEKTADRMKRFLQSLSLAPEHILLIAPPPMVPGEWVTDPALLESSRLLAGYYRELAGQLGVRFADAGNWHVTLAYDGVHFTGQGHRAFAEKLAQEVCR